MKSYAPKVPKQDKAKRDGVRNPQNYNLTSILMLTIYINDKDFLGLLM